MKKVIFVFIALIVICCSRNLQVSNSNTSSSSTDSSSSDIDFPWGPVLGIGIPVGFLIGGCIGYGRSIAGKGRSLTNFIVGGLIGALIVGLIILLLFICLSNPASGEVI